MSEEREYRTGLNYILRSTTAEIIFAIQEQIFDLAEKYGIDLKAVWGEYIAYGTEENVKKFVNELEELINDTVKGREKL